MATVMQFKVRSTGNPHHGAVLHPDPRTVDVPPDHFEVAEDDVLFTASLEATLAVCLYDAVEEHGALLHLRFIARGASQTDVTDRTLASDLLLLDRCVERFRDAMERGIDVQGKIAASVEAGEPARLAADAVLALIGEYLKDAGVRVVSREIEYGRACRLRFRPSMGQLRLE
ncbi:MAG: hypothetical protein KIT78_00930 [Steroidobacteraceae bacterium]|nr:hypothetical protein [Steroidobacteraceae bacterium]